MGESLEVGPGGRELGHWEHILKGDIGTIIPTFLCLCFLDSIAEPTLPYTAT